MTSRLQWYYSRLRTMNAGELIFRGNQARQRYFEKIFPASPEMKSVTVEKPAIEFSFDGKSPSNEFFIFGKSIDIASPINFHQDIFSGRSFPLDFSKTIDMRTDRYGSAKAVWEVNRLQFLIPLLIEYVTGKDKSKLDLFVSIVSDWDKQNPYMKGLNWYSNIEVNIRLINWYWCWLLLENDPQWKESAQYESFRNDTWMPLIYKHCYYSSRNPSFFSSANNHLIAEYTGLYMACSLWKFPESAQWAKKAKAGLEKEIMLQHSENGVNREEADAYIQFITDFFLQAYIAGKIAKEPFSEAYEQRLIAICSYIHELLDIRDNIPGYGDNDDGRVILPDGRMQTNNFVSILNTAAVIFQKPEWKRSRKGWDIKSDLLTAFISGRNDWQKMVATRRDTGSRFFKNEGHFILRKRTGEDRELYCHFDAAPLGYLSIAAHGHADALSVIVHVDGYPFLVDPGTYAYHTHQEWRKYFTSTLAHNTITIDDENQSLMAGPTLWLDHFRATVLEAVSSPELDRVRANHDGYKRKGVRHERSVVFDKRVDILQLEDEISLEKGSFNLKMPFHLHPDVIAVEKATNIYLLRHPGTTTCLEISLDPSLKVSLIKATNSSELAWYSDAFMKKQPSSVIMGEFNSDKKTTLNTTIKLIVQS